MLSTRLETSLFPLPITRTTRAKALAFAEMLSDHPIQAQQVRLNALAVGTVQDYLELMGIPFDLASSYSQNSVLRLMADTADIVIPGVGRIECRPLLQDVGSLNGQSACLVPPEVQGDRLGYIVVQLSPDYASANIVGYYPAPVHHESTESTETPAHPALNPLYLDQLQPIDALLDYIDQFELAAPPVVVPEFPADTLLEQMFTSPSPALAPAIQDPPVPAPAALTRLGDWLTHLADEVILEGWEIWSSFQPYSRYACRRGDRPGDAKRAKRVSLQLANRETIELGLLVTLEAPTPNAKILVQLQALSDVRPILPPDVALTILDGRGKILRTACARDRDILLQLELWGQPEECFGVEVSLAETRFVETFMI
jgi:Protein of unknown function (DUF1822)